MRNSILVSLILFALLSCNSVDSGQNDPIMPDLTNYSPQAQAVILDLGPYSTPNSMELAQAVSEVIGVDIDPQRRLQGVCDPEPNDGWYDADFWADGTLMPISEEQLYHAAHINQDTFGWGEVGNGYSGCDVFLILWELIDFYDSMFIPGAFSDMLTYTLETCADGPPGGWDVPDERDIFPEDHCPDLFD